MHHRHEAAAAKERGGNNGRTCGSSVVRGRDGRRSSRGICGRPAMGPQATVRSLPAPCVGTLLAAWGPAQARQGEQPGEPHYAILAGVALSEPAGASGR